ncbi:hypothetical protein AVEN_138427-1 [Araneus ventricosus]|uniref:MATH domain-containing protein n=1 Tax=Araneus ventricosus TaxID=182803 RepID=A0A4Y2LK50_ARAVE|nr:hypothetical protein AVEN_138427-1 [Araneus ventricosus]
MGAEASKNSGRKPNFTFIWTIENGSALLVSRYLESPQFIAHSIAKTKWKLMVNTEFRHETLHLDIQREEDSGPDTIEIEFELSILSDNGSVSGMQTGKETFPISHCFHLKIFEDRHEVFFRRRAEFLPNDTLTVRCRMWRTGTEISRSETWFARTRLGLDRRCFVWVIKEFSSLRPEQKRTHFVNPTPHGSPQLILSLFLSERNGKNYVNIEIGQNDATRYYNMFCKCSLLESDGRVVHSEKTESVISLHFRKVCIFQEFLEKDKLMNKESSLLLNDELYLRCEFQIEADPVWSRIEN